MDIASEQGGRVSQLFPYPEPLQCAQCQCEGESRHQLSGFWSQRLDPCPTCRVQPDLCVSRGPSVQPWLVCHTLCHDDMPGWSILTLGLFVKTFLKIFQENGIFDEPEWDDYLCVYREYNIFLFKYWIIYYFSATTTECYDCTTTSKIHSLIHPFMFLPVSKWYDVSQHHINCQI